eukprot:CAMPEP_0171272458 /NCGR_PEP_ID=MMETSP0790-20130122/61770_1 /TAXON_ID=2925 /ORGANISM="Alexandrium catenella, Strain OF101" /LENGTH=90 /DNA_ID=CAMNT_0011741397 /DNA_START=1 /DNA_END=269 /DNA_ORIENTATION=+
MATGGSSMPLLLLLLSASLAGVHCAREWHWSWESAALMQVGEEVLSRHIEHWQNSSTAAAGAQPQGRFVQRASEEHSVKPLVAEEPMGQG